MSNSSKRDDNPVRKSKESLRQPDPAELDRIDALSDEDIDCSDIPEIRLSANDGNGRLVLLRLDEETFQYIRNQAIDADRIRELILAHIEKQSGDAA